jgi:homoserine O-succinyltransferase
MPLVLAKSDRSTESLGVRPIEIGLLNNLSDAGLAGGDRQIIELLQAVAGPQTVRLHFFSLPAIARGPAARTHMAARYSAFAEMPTANLDGLFVTGCEPRMPRLPQEPFWQQLTDVIDWAEHNTRSTIFSCLAAHAAVLHLDGIERRSLPQKCNGLFPVTTAIAHPLLADAPADLRVPHSRFNDLDAAALEAAGYSILTQGSIVGVDTFLKSWRSLFVYLQGHPEYDADALRREYRRDVLRFLDGTSERYPDLPVGYFDAVMTERLEIFASKARRDRDPRLIAALPLESQGPSIAGWNRGFATTLFRNWLHYLHAKTSNHAA